MRDTKLDAIVVAADVDPIVAGIHHLQSAEMPEVSVDLQAAIARRERLSGEVDYRPLAPEGENPLGETIETIVASSDGNGGGIVIGAPAHEDG